MIRVERGIIQILPLLILATLAITTFIIVQRVQTERQDLRGRAATVYPPTPTPISTLTPTPTPPGLIASGYPCNTHPQCQSGYCEPFSSLCKSKPLPSSTPTPTPTQILPTKTTTPYPSCASPNQCIKYGCPAGYAPVTATCSIIDSVCCKATPVAPTPTPGLFTDGFPCGSNSQCKSGYCDGPSGLCRQRPLRYRLDLAGKQCVQDPNGSYVSIAICQTTLANALAPTPTKTPTPIPSPAAKYPQGTSCGTFTGKDCSDCQYPAIARGFGVSECGAAPTAIATPLPAPTPRPTRYDIVDNRCILKSDGQYGSIALCETIRAQLALGQVTPLPTRGVTPLPTVPPTPRPTPMIASTSPTCSGGVSVGGCAALGSNRWVRCVGAGENSNYPNATWSTFRDDASCAPVVQVGELAVQLQTEGVGNNAITCQNAAAQGVGCSSAAYGECQVGPGGAMYACTCDAGGSFRYPTYEKVSESSSQCNVRPQLVQQAIDRAAGDYEAFVGKYTTVSNTQLLSECRTQMGTTSPTCVNAETYYNYLLTQLLPSLRDDATNARTQYQQISKIYSLVVTPNNEAQLRSTCLAERGSLTECRDLTEYLNTLMSRLPQDMRQQAVSTRNQYSQADQNYALYVNGSPADLAAKCQGEYRNNLLALRELCSDTEEYRRRLLGNLPQEYKVAATNARVTVLRVAEDQSLFLNATDADLSSECARRYTTSQERRDHCDDLALFKNSLLLAFDSKDREAAQAQRTVNVNVASQLSGLTGAERIAQANELVQKQSECNASLPGSLYDASKNVCILGPASSPQAVISLGTGNQPVAILGGKFCPAAGEVYDPSLDRCVSNRGVGLVIGTCTKVSLVTTSNSCTGGYRCPTAGIGTQTCVPDLPEEKDTFGNRFLVDLLDTQGPNLTSGKVFQGATNTSVNIVGSICADAKNAGTAGAICNVSTVKPVEVGGTYLTQANAQYADRILQNSQLLALYNLYGERAPEYLTEDNRVDITKFSSEESDRLNSTAQQIRDTSITNVGLTSAITGRMTPEQFAVDPSFITAYYEANGQESSAVTNVYVPNILFVDGKPVDTAEAFGVEFREQSPIWGTISTLGGLCDACGLVQMRAIDRIFNPGSSAYERDRIVGSGVDSLGSLMGLTGQPVDLTGATYSDLTPEQQQLFTLASQSVRETNQSALESTWQRVAYPLQNVGAFAVGATAALATGGLSLGWQIPIDLGYDLVTTYLVEKTTTSAGERLVGKIEEFAATNPDNTEAQTIARTVTQNYAVAKTQEIAFLLLGDIGLNVAGEAFGNLVSARKLVSQLAPSVEIATVGTRGIVGTADEFIEAISDTARLNFRFYGVDDAGKVVSFTPGYAPRAVDLAGLTLYQIDDVAQRAAQQVIDGGIQAAKPGAFSVFSERRVVENIIDANPAVADSLRQMAPVQTILAQEQRSILSQIADRFRGTPAEEPVPVPLGGTVAEIRLDIPGAPRAVNPGDTLVDINGGRIVIPSADPNLPVQYVRIVDAEGRIAFAGSTADPNFNTIPISSGARIQVTDTPFAKVVVGETLSDTTLRGFTRVESVIPGPASVDTVNLLTAIVRTGGGEFTGGARVYSVTDGKVTGILPLESGGQLRILDADNRIVADLNIGAQNVEQEVAFSDALRGIGDQPEYRLAYVDEAPQSSLIGRVHTGTKYPAVEITDATFLAREGAPLLEPPQPPSTFVERISDFVGGIVLPSRKLTIDTVDTAAVMKGVDGTEYGVFRGVDDAARALSAGETPSGTVVAVAREGRTPTFYTFTGEELKPLTPVANIAQRIPVLARGVDPSTGTFSPILLIRNTAQDILPQGNILRETFFADSLRNGELDDVLTSLSASGKRGTIEILSVDGTPIGKSFNFDPSLPKTHATELSLAYYQGQGGTLRFTPLDGARPRLFEAAQPSAPRFTERTGIGNRLVDFGQEVAQRFFVSGSTVPKLVDNVIGGKLVTVSDDIVLYPGRSSRIIIGDSTIDIPQSGYIRIFDSEGTIVYAKQIAPFETIPGDKLQPGYWIQVEPAGRFTGIQTSGQLTTYTRVATQISEEGLRIRQTRTIGQVWDDLVASRFRPEPDARFAQIEAYAQRGPDRAGLAVIEDSRATARVRSFGGKIPETETAYRLAIPDGASAELGEEIYRYNGLIDRFEASFGHHLRPQQIELLTSPEAILQLEAGGGKTSVIGPMLAASERRTIFTLPTSSDATSFVNDVVKQGSFYDGEGIRIYFFDNERGFLEVGPDFNRQTARTVSPDVVRLAARNAARNSEKNGLMIISESSDNAWGLIRGRLPDADAASRLLHDLELGDALGGGKYTVVVDEIGAVANSRYSVSLGEPASIAQLSDPVNLHGLANGQRILAVSDEVRTTSALSDFRAQVLARIEAGQSPSDLFFRQIDENGVVTIKPWPADAALRGGAFADILEQTLRDSSLPAGAPVRTELEGILSGLRANSADARFHDAFQGIVGRGAVGQADSDILADLAYRKADLQARWYTLSRVPGNDFGQEGTEIVLRRAGGTTGETYASAVQKIALHTEGPAMLEASGLPVARGELLETGRLTITPDSNQITNAEIYRQVRYKGYDATPTTAANSLGVRATDVSERPPDPSRYYRSGSGSDVIREGLRDPSYLAVTQGKARAFVLADEGVPFRQYTDAIIEESPDAEVLFRTKYITEPSGAVRTEYYSEAIVRNADGTFVRREISLASQDEWNAAIQRELLNRADRPQSVLIIYEGRTRAVDLKVTAANKQIRWSVVAGDQNNMEDITQAFKRNRVPARADELLAEGWTTEEITDASSYTLFFRSQDGRFTGDTVIDSYFRPVLDEQLATVRFEQTVDAFFRQDEALVSARDELLSMRPGERDRIFATFDELRADARRVAFAQSQEIQTRPLSGEAIPEEIYTRGRVAYDAMQARLNALRDEFGLTEDQTTRLAKLWGIDEPYLARAEFERIFTQTPTDPSISRPVGPAQYARYWAETNNPDTTPRFAWHQKTDPDTVQVARRAADAIRATRRVAPDVAAPVEEGLSIAERANRFIQDFQGGAAALFTRRIDRLRPVQPETPAPQAPETEREPLPVEASPTQDTIEAVRNIVGQSRVLIAKAAQQVRAVPFRNTVGTVIGNARTIIADSDLRQVLADRQRLTEGLKQEVNRIVTGRPGQIVSSTARFLTVKPTDEELTNIGLTRDTGILQRREGGISSWINAAPFGAMRGGKIVNRQYAFSRYGIAETLRWVITRGILPAIIPPAGLLHTYDWLVRVPTFVLRSFRKSPTPAAPITTEIPPDVAVSAVSRIDQVTGEYIAALPSDQQKKYGGNIGELRTKIQELLLRGGGLSVTLTEGGAQVNGRQLSPVGKPGGQRQVFDLEDGNVLKVDISKTSSQNLLEIIIWSLAREKQEYLVPFIGWGVMDDGRIYIIEKKLGPFAPEDSFEEITLYTADNVFSEFKNVQADPDSLAKFLLRYGLRSAEDALLLEKLFLDLNDYEIFDLSSERQIGRTEDGRPVVSDFAVANIPGLVQYVGYVKKLQQMIVDDVLPMLQERTFSSAGVSSGTEVTLNQPSGAVGTVVDTMGEGEGAYYIIRITNGRGQGTLVSRTKEEFTVLADNTRPEFVTQAIDKEFRVFQEVFNEQAKHTSGFMFEGRDRYSFETQSLLHLDSDQVISDMVRTRNSIRILDVGTGNGQFLEHAVSEYPDRVTVAGLSASDYRSEANPLTGIDYRTGNAEYITTLYPQESFDLIISAVTVAHFVDPLGAIEQMYKLLAQDGMLVIDYFEVPGLEGKLSDVISYLHERGYTVYASYENDMTYGRQEVQFDTFIIKKTLPELRFPISYQPDAQTEHGFRYILSENVQYYPNREVEILNKVLPGEFFAFSDFFRERRRTGTASEEEGSLLPILNEYSRHLLERNAEDKAYVQREFGLNIGDSINKEFIENALSQTAGNEQDSTIRSVLDRAGELWKNIVARIRRIISPSIVPE